MEIKYNIIIYCLFFFSPFLISFRIGFLQHNVCKTTLQIQQVNNEPEFRPDRAPNKWLHTLIFRGLYISIYTCRQADR